ncbi:phosphotransferase enzyme family protein [Aeribacillus pallidus]|uniref:phosphotransferase enzyme family protein n=1 Tax=Aeribacillus pallidus TaxID=33936 RepID=UPI003D1AFB95
MNLRQSTLIAMLTPLYGSQVSDFQLVTEGYQNMMVRCNHQGETVFIRVTAARRKSVSMIEAELEWLRILRKTGLSVPSPRISNKENWIETITLRKNTFYAIAFSKVYGRSIDVTKPQQWNDHLFEKWGETLGQIHSAVPNHKIARPYWGGTFTSVSDTIAFFEKNEDCILKARLFDIVSQIENLSRSTDTFGLIHNDFHQGNVLVHEKGIGIIDFDDCEYGWYAQDIAVALYHAFWQATALGSSDLSFGFTFLQSFLNGYRKTRNLSPETVQQIPLFLRWRDFVLYALFMKNWPLDSLEAWQTYTLDRLRKRMKHRNPIIPLSSNELTILSENS